MNRIDRLFLLLATVLAFALPGTLRAQAAWDGPMLMAPGAPAGLGIHLISPSAGDGIGALATWRADPAPIGLGFRAGVVEGAVDDISVIAGVDISGTLYRGGEGLPLDFIWFAGAGAGIDDYVTLSFPAGISAGWSFAGPEVQFRPYLAPRIVLDAFLGVPVVESGSEDDLDLAVAVEVGLDLAFSQPWSIRTSASFGDREALSIGVSFPTGSVGN